MKETDTELDARIRKLREQLRLVIKELRAAERKREARREREYERDTPQRARFKNAATLRRASAPEHTLIQKLLRMTVANGCTEAEAKAAREKLRKLGGWNRLE